MRLVTIANENAPRREAASAIRAVCMAGNFNRTPYNRRAMDSIVIRDLRIEVRIGIHKREQHVAQIVSIDHDIGLPGETVFASDRVADTIDYEQVALQI